MSVFRKILAGVLAAATMLTLASCADTSIAATVDGTSIRAGIYIYSLMNAVYEGESVLKGDTETEIKDPWSEKIEDKSFSDWVKDKATEYVQEYVAIERKFDELKLSFDETDEYSIDNYINYYWDEAHFNDLGVSKQSFTDVVTNSYKRDKVFNKYYNTDGIEEVPEQDVKVFFEDNYVRYKRVDFLLTDGAGKDLDDKGKTEVLDMAKDYLARAQEGEDFNDLIAEYTEYRAKLEAKAADKEYTAPEVDEDEEADEFANERLANIEHTTPSEKFIKFLFETAKVDESEIFQDDKKYYLVQKLDIFGRDDLLDSYRSTILYELKGDEFNELVSTWAAELDVERNEKAYKRYNPKKMGF